MLVIRQLFQIHNFQENYNKILLVLNSIESKKSFITQIRRLKSYHKNLISINLTSEYMGIDSESQLFRILPLKVLNKT